MATQEEMLAMERVKNSMIEELREQLSDVKKDIAAEGSLHIRTREVVEISSDKGTKEAVTEHKLEETKDGNTREEAKMSLSTICVMSDSKVVDHAVITKSEENRKNASHQRKKCFGCGSEEHSIKDCTSNTGNDNHGRRFCNICKKIGHNAAECWFKDQKDGVRKCFRCGSSDHLVKSCSQPRQIGMPQIWVRNYGDPDTGTKIHEQYRRYRTKEEKTMITLIAASTMWKNCNASLCLCQKDKGKGR